MQSLLHSKALLRDRERELLRKVFAEENSKFDIELVGQSAMKLIASSKRKWFTFKEIINYINKINLNKWRTPRLVH